MLQIQLGALRAARTNDPLGRATLGYHPAGMTEAEAWTAGRGVWKLRLDRALAQDEVQIVNTDGTVLAVARITGVTKHGDRFALEGELLAGDPRVGQPTATPHPSRNSTAYFDL
jgi:hypothetical protein